MDIPSRYAPREQERRLPSMPSELPVGFHGSRGSGFPPGGFSSGPFAPTLGSSIPMPINNARFDQGVPPPLPPPRAFNISGPMADDALKYIRDCEATRAQDEEMPSYKRRMEVDEGYHSMSSFGSKPPSANFGMLHNQFQFKSSANALDNSMLNRLGSKPRPSGPFGSSLHDPSRPTDRFPPLAPLSLPSRQKAPSMLSSPTRYNDTPVHSAVSPRTMPFGLNDHHMDGPPFPRTRNNSGDDATISTQDSYDAADNDGDFAMEETSRLRDFHIDGHQAAGHKRRASSPPGDEPQLHSMPSAGDLLRQRNGVSRGSPQPRLSVIPQGSISSVSSGGRTGSYSSNYPLTASSMTSMASFSAAGRRSPVSPRSLASADPNSCTSPFATPMSLTTSPRPAVARNPHHRTLSEQNRQPMMSPRRTEIPNVTVTKMANFFICDCCPKKPRKFETPEELSAHEAEKQYECGFCGNRFKNKNEAERHQNSLHVRRHSWSCSALSGYDRAFYESTNRPGEADACGYCGEEFPRSGQAAGRGGPCHATQQDWDDRIRHLQDLHKFRECNSTKKFYRADHFRQHLKHSHAGTSGKWTNMLENACMIEEEPPLPPTR